MQLENRTWPPWAAPGAPGLTAMYMLHNLLRFLTLNLLSECATRMKTRMEANFEREFTCAVTDTDTNEHENHKSQRFGVHENGWRAMCDYRKRMPRFEIFK